MNLFLLRKAHVKAHTRRTASGSTVQVRDYERWSAWTGYTHGQGITRWKTEKEAKAALAEAKKKLGKKYEFQLRPVAAQAMRMAPDAPGGKPRQPRVTSWFEIEYRWPVAAPVPQPAAPAKPKRQPARPEVKLVTNLRKLRASLKKKAAAEAEKQAREKKETERARRAGKKRLKKTPLKVGLDVLYKPDEAERARVGTVKRINKQTVVVQGRRRADGTAPTYTVPLKSVMAYQDYQRAKGSDDPRYAPSPRKTMARRQLTPGEGRRRKEAAEKRLGMSENEIFTTPKVDGYITYQVDKFIKQSSGLGPGDFAELKSAFTLGMLLDLRRRLADPKTPAAQLKQFRAHVQRPYEPGVYNPEDTSDLWWLSAKAGRNALIAHAKEKREREQREETYSPQDVENPLSESLTADVGAFLRKKYGQKLGVDPDQESVLEERQRGALPVLLEGFIDRMPPFYSDVVRRVHALGAHANEREEGQTFQQIADDYRKLGKPKYLDKYEWDRNYVGRVYGAALEMLRNMEGIDVLRSYVHKSDDGLLRAIFGEPRSRFRKALSAVKERLGAVMSIVQPPRALAVDFDGVISDYSKGFQGTDVFGEPVDGAAEGLQKLKNAGWRIVVHTAREHTPALEAYLQEHAIPYDEIAGKPIADLYLDDRGRQFVSWDRFADEVGLAKSERHHRLNGPLEAWFPEATVLPAAWGTCIVAAQDDEALQKSWSSDLQKKYAGGRWITVTDQSSPLHGRHIFILPHKGGTASVLVGGGPALQHKIFDRKEKEKPDPDKGGGKKPEEKPAEDKPEMTDEQRAEVQAKQKDLKQKIQAERTEMAEKIRQHMGVETEVTEEEKRAIEKKVGAIADPKEKQKVAAQEHAKVRKEKDDTLHQIIQDVKKAVLEEEPTGQGKASIHAVVKEHLEDVLNNWYAIQALKKENRTLSKVLRKNKPFTSALQSVEFEKMDRRQLQDVIADEKMREADLEAHYKLMATARGVVDIDTEREIQAPEGNGEMVRNITQGGFEAFTGVVGEFTGDTILKKARYEVLDAQNAAVLAHWYLSQKLGGDLKDKIGDLQEYIEKVGSKVAHEAVQKGDRFMAESRQVIGYGRGADGLMAAAQANATSLRWKKKAWEAYGQAEGALTQAAELMHQFAAGGRKLELTSNSRDSLESQRRKLGLSPLDAPIVKTRGEPYKLKVPEKSFEKILSVGKHEDTDGPGFGMEGHKYTPAEIKEGRANTDDYHPGQTREYTPPDKAGVSRKIIAQPHQQAAARLIAQQQRVYLNHEAGTGKSLSVLLAKGEIEEQTGKKVTMIALMPGKTLRNYKGEVDTFTGYDTVVVDGDKKKRAKQYASAPAGSVVALNHEKMREDPAMIRELIARVKAEGGIPMIVVDEAHKLTQRESRSKKSMMSEQLLATVKESPYYVAMSGTPVPSDLSELYFHAHAMDPQRFSSQKEFMAKFGTAHKGVGLKDKIRAFMATELDDRVHTVKKQLDTEFRMHDERTKLTAGQRGEYRRIMEEARAKRIQPFQRDAQLNELLNGGSWQENPKFARALEIVDKHMKTKGPDEKVIFYAPNRYTVREIQAMLKAKYPDAEHVLFTGEESIKQAGENKKRFKGDPKVRFSIHMKAGVEGLNLQYDGKGGGATTAIAMASGEHTYATIDQFMSRANRTGAQKAIDGHLLLTDTPHDMATQLRLDEKKEVGELIRNKADLQKAMRTGLLVQSRVKAHTRRTKDGGSSLVREHERKPRVGDKVHLGLAGKGGTGHHGMVTKIEGETVHIESEAEGKFGKRTWKGPLKNATVVGNADKKIGVVRAAASVLKALGYDAAAKDVSEKNVGRYLDFLDAELAKQGRSVDPKTRAVTVNDSVRAKAEVMRHMLRGLRREVPLQKSYTPEQQEKIAKVMREFQAGTLRSYSGEKVTDKKQALAIALHEAGVEMKKSHRLLVL